MALLEALRTHARLGLADVLDALYPPRCALCGASAANSLACPQHALPSRPPGVRCERCAAPMARALAGARRCAECQRRSPGFARLVVLADYRAQPEIRDWVLALKHGGRRDLAAVLAHALAVRWRAAEPGRRLEDDVLVPVPLHPWRRWERGYDQAALLADALGFESGAPVVRALVRSRATVVQGSAGAVSRSANVRGAFRASRWGSRRRESLCSAPVVWLVDDVVTSGATLRECARALRRLGAPRIHALALARARARQGDGGAADVAAR